MIRNAAPSRLYEHGLRNEPGTAIASSGAFIAMSGEKTGRSPGDKRIVEEPSSKDEVWWGPVNMGINEHVFMINRERAIDYLNTRPQLYVVDGSVLPTSLGVNPQLSIMSIATRLAWRMRERPLV